VFVMNALSPLSSPQFFRWGPRWWNCIERFNLSWSLYMSASFCGHFNGSPIDTLLYSQSSILLWCRYTIRFSRFFTVDSVSVTWSLQTFSSFERNYSNISFVLCSPFFPAVNGWIWFDSLDDYFFIPFSLARFDVHYYQCNLHWL